MACSAYKVVLAGDGQTGKSCYVHRLLGGEALPTYVPTLGLEVNTLRLPLAGVGTVGEVVNLWDTAGQEKFGGLRDGYYLQADGALLFYRPEAHAFSQDRWLADIRRACPNIPVVAVAHGANSDHTYLRAKISWDQEEYFGPKWGVLDTIGVSTKNNLHLEEPLLTLLKKIRT